MRPMLVDPVQPEAIADGILKVLQQRAPARRHAASAGWRACRAYSWERSVARVREVYGEVCMTAAAEPARMSRARVALVHDWLTGMRGGEKVLEVLCRDCIRQPICSRSSTCPDSVSPAIERHRPQDVVSPAACPASSVFTATAFRCFPWPSSSSISMATISSSAPATAPQRRW